VGGGTSEGTFGGTKKIREGARRFGKGRGFLVGLLGEKFPFSKGNGK